MANYSQVSSTSDDGSETPFLESTIQRSPSRSRLLKFAPWLLHLLLLGGNMILFYVISISCKPEPRFSNHQPIDDSMMSWSVRSLDKGWGEQNPKNTSERIIYTGFENDDVDEAWLRLYYPISRIKLTAAEVSAANLSTVQYHDDSGLYVSSIDVAHQIHCLDEVRKATAPEYYKPMVNAKMQRDHVAHCINYLRQVLMCKGDVTLLEYHNVESEGPGSYRQRTEFQSPQRCADYGTIFDWAYEKRVKNPEERLLIHYPYAEDIAKGVVE